MSASAKDRIPAHDLDAEASVLSALMLDPDRVASVEPVLSPEDFYSDANRRIARVIWALDGAQSKIDETTVAHELRARDELVRIGGAQYIAQICDATPAVAHVVDHAKIVAMAARVRRVQSECHRVVAEAYSPLQDAEAWIQDVERRIFEATDSASIRPETIRLMPEAVAEETEALRDRVHTKKSPGRKTHIVALDAIFGGLVDAVPYVLAGRPGHGKTGLAWQIVEGVAKDGALGIMFSQEMPRQQLVQRAIAQIANLEVRKIRNGWIGEEEWGLVDAAASYLEGLPIAIDDRGAQTVQSIRSGTRRCIQKLRAKGHTGPLGIIVVDYLQIMGSDGTGDDNRSTEVGANMHGLTALAREFRCPVLVLSQLNRNIENRTEKRPKLSDLGESGAIEADGYGVMFVYREDCYRPKEEHDGRAEIIVAKNRNGRLGTAKCLFMPSTYFAADPESPEEDAA